ncbi:hypothetical protein ARHIZOSPH14_27690 [Agromyces rhizosphaerae]|uniref:Uncharacterized protein n=1 Tax=Agromyces rhizosphaerae TaxID=88374 RepID=A0A9W6CXN5_9MICO|nr:hypothetical protein [Agromyces rhizosphaerae]GLI28527.1 hypothetical protein ARHIZOSPH14_27690 [Agromyces rhizosphaerae]
MAIEQVALFMDGAVVALVDVRDLDFDGEGAVGWDGATWERRGSWVSAAAQARAQGLPMPGQTLYRRYDRVPDPETAPNGDVPLDDRL